MLYGFPIHKSLHDADYNITVRHNSQKKKVMRDNVKVRFLKLTEFGWSYRSSYSTIALDIYPRQIYFILDLLSTHLC